MCPLNINTKQIVEPSGLKEILPDSREIPYSVHDMDTDTISRCLSPDKLSKIWADFSDDIVTEDQRVTIYWHYRLRNFACMYLYRLSKSGFLPKGIHI